MVQETLGQMIEASRSVFGENEGFYADNACPLINAETSIILNETTFIDLLNDGATGLEFMGTAIWGGGEHYEYHALYHGRKIAVVLENPINEI